MYREIDLSDWTLFSERFNSKNYYNKDKTLHLKLINNNANADALDEYNKANLLYNSGILTPRALEIVTHGDCTGIIFEYIKNKKSILRAVAENPDTLSENMIRYGRTLRKLHDTKCDTSVFLDMLADTISKVEKSNILTDRQKNTLLNTLRNTENRDTYLMKDINPSNFLMVEDKIYVIDIGELAYGNSLLDLGTWYDLLFIRGRFIHFIVERIYRTKLEIFRQGWPIFIKAYFENEDDEYINRQLKLIPSYGIIQSFLDIEKNNLPKYLNWFKAFVFSSYYKKVMKIIQKQ